MEARKLHTDYGWQKEEIEKKKELRKTKRAKNSKLFSIGVKVLSITVIAVILAICLLMLKGYAAISAVQQEIIALEKEKKELTAEKNDLNAEIEAIKASTKIQEEAKYKLGMVYPTDDQVVYISVGDSSVLGSARKINNLDKILNLVSNNY